MQTRKVVVTGIGLVTAVGLNRDSTWEAMKAGKSGVATISSLDTEDFKSTIAAELKDFDPTAVMDPKNARKADRYAQIAVVAAAEAMAQAGEPVPEDPYRAGVIIGSGIGGMLTFEEQHARFLKRGCRAVSPLFIPMMISDMAAGLVSIRYGYKGANFCTVSACASGGHAIVAAYDRIAFGQADIMISGGSEASVCNMALSGFANMKALSTRNDDPAGASRPFDKDRDGFVIGEGGGALVLESEEHAKARGATILGEIVSYGMTGDAYHMTQPDNEGIGARGSMQAALDMGGLAPEDVGYLNAHGTSTHFNDKIESFAVRKVFGKHAEKLKISATKSMVGHLLGGAGAVEAAATLLALGEGILPPTINYTTPDPECDLDYCPNEAVRADVTYALSNSFGFGGHNVTLCMRGPR
ncbi:MAG: beta-ketoacyl-ACP synthase II [bacterium]|nr:beta-ketoacyl-ACP synthase II [bacterium]